MTDRETPIRSQSSASVGSRVPDAYSLVILTNTDDAHAPALVEKLHAPFEVVITAEQAQAYKPRPRAFEYMLEKSALRKPLRASPGVGRWVRGGT